MRATRHAFAMLSRLAAAVAFVAASTASAHDGVCKSATAPSEAMLAASKELESDPQDLNARLKLADALMAANCVEDAVHTLEEGEALHGRNAELQSHLREARSMVREQSYFEGLNRAEEAAKMSRSLLRCSKLGDIEECDQALARKPDDPQILIAKADALVQAKRPAEALGVYRRAREVAPGDATLGEKIAAAEAQRHTFLGTCQSATGQVALQACRSALMPGGDDEFEILKRTGTLLQASNQPSAALDSFIAADQVKHGDRAIAQSIVSLSASTGRRDAFTLAARGSALLTLGRALDALTPLKQALTLSPDLPEAKAQLVKAERLAQEEVRQKVAAVAAEKAAAPAVAEAASARRYSNAAPATRSN